MSTPAQPVVTAVPTGTNVGGQSTFSAAFLQSAGGPAGTLQAGSIPQWSCPDANVTLTESADGTSCVAAVAAGDTNPNFVLTCTAVNSDGNPISGNITEPINQPAPPPPPPPPDQAATVVVVTKVA